MVFYDSGCGTGRFSLFLALGCDVMAVHAADVVELDILRTFSGTCACIGAVAETEFVHLLDHCACTAFAFNLTLGQESKLADLRRNKEHGRSVLTSCNACAAADTSCGVHRNVGDFL